MKHWLYFILNRTGKSYSIENGVVNISPTLKPISVSPDGWQELSIGYHRDLNKLGITRSFTIQLGFVLDGADILRHISITKNFEEEVFLFIARLTLEKDGNAYRWVYKPFYKGEIDLSSLKDDGIKATVNVIEGGLNKLVKAGENTVYEYDIDSDPDMIAVKMDGIKITGSYKWILPEDAAVGGQNVRAMVKVGEEQIAPGVAALDMSGGFTYNPNTVNRDSTEYFAQISIAPEDGKGKFTGVINMLEPRTEFPAFIALYIYNTFTDARRTVMLYEGNEATDCPVNVEFDIQAGDRFFFTVDEPIKESELTFTVTTRLTTSYVKGIRASTLFKRICSKITGYPTSPALSMLLDQYGNYVVTCGDAIRGLAGANIKTSLNQFFETFKAILGAGLGIENGKIVLEKYEHFLKTDNPIPLGKVKDLSISYATDLMGNSLKIGYPKTDTDDVNGKYAFNNTHSYTLPVTKIQKEINLVAHYKSDPYAEELLRINLEGKTTTDNSSDNDVFILDVTEQAKSFTASVSFSIIPGVHLNMVTVTGNVDRLQDFKPGVRFTLTDSIGLASVYTVTSAAQSTGSGFLFFVQELVTPGSAIYTFSFSSYTLNRPAMTITGVPSPDTIFNISLSPKRMLHAQSRWIASILHQFEGQKLTFQTTEKNADLVADGIAEKADYTISNNRLFIPRYVEFETEVPINLPEIKQNDPNRCFSFEWNGHTFIGFDVKAAIAPNDMKPQNYKLLLAPNTDLSKLI